MTMVTAISPATAAEPDATVRARIQDIQRELTPAPVVALLAVPAGLVKSLYSIINLRRGE
jgi:hypothetical protein